ncbi:MAG TPA: class I SAM-dependent methyltransferase [Thermoplasmata archaeon]|nr:class I SAM-dependent methyltransferase [Thermoplasmata archaeon]
MAADRAPAPDEVAADAYSLIAGRYDELEDEPVLVYMRSRSLGALRETMPRDGRLLELGCGTGTEALVIAGELGASVVACEPSAGMLSVAEKKVAESGADVELLHASAGDALRSLVERGQSFDGAWASFSLSYDEPLDSLRAPLAAVLKPGAPFVCTLRNTFCFGEPWSFVSRVSGIYRHRVGGRRVALRHHTPRRRAGARP